MRVLEVIPSLHPGAGGTAEAVRQVVAARHGRVARQTVVSFDADSASIPPVPQAGLVCIGRGWGRYGYRPSAVRVLRELAQGHDLVTIHGIWQYHALATRQALAGTGIPYVVFPHGMLDPWFNRDHPLKQLKKHLYWSVVERANLGAAAAVCFTAEDEQRLARTSFAGYRAHEAMVGFGIVEPPPADPAQITAYRAVVPDLGDRRTILFLGRLHAKKGCDLLVEAFLARFGADPEMCLVMAGPDPDGIGAELRQRFPSPRIFWPGALSGAAKWGALRSAEAFALLSHQENFGIAVVEALACGTPVLITRAINIASQIERACGGLVTTNDPAGAYRVLGEWQQATPDQKAAMRRAARTCFEEQFDLHSAIERHLQLFRQVIAGDLPATFQTSE